jgi:dUTP pyrophosphatase
MMIVKIKKTNDFKMPQYKTEGSSGMDLSADIEEPIVLKPLERYLVPTGIYIEIPVGYEAQIRARSGLAIKNGISLVNGIGTIDSDYRGEIKVILINLGGEDFTINRGDRIAQMIFAKVEIADIEEVEIVDETARGAGGFGHTGIK